VLLSFRKLVVIRFCRELALSSPNEYYTVPGIFNSIFQFCMNPQLLNYLKPRNIHRKIFLKWNMAIGDIFWTKLSLTIESAWISFRVRNGSKLCSACMHPIVHEPGPCCSNRPSCLWSKELEELPDLLYADIGSKSNGYDAMV
jgi:hypothetical protein